MSSSWFLTGCCEKFSHRGKIGGKRGKFALATIFSTCNIRTLTHTDETVYQNHFLVVLELQGTCEVKPTDVLQDLSILNIARRNGSKKKHWFHGFNISDLLEINIHACTFQNYI